MHGPGPSLPAALSVVAIGGNSLIDPAMPPTVDSQFRVTARAMAPIAALIARGERLVLTHGNGPQVGFMQMRVELSRDRIHEVPLDSLVADSQGSLGYMIQRDLRRELRRRRVDAEVVTVVTEVGVDPGDHAFLAPTKPVGKFYSAAEAESLRRERGWRMVEDSHRGWRRVVPSPPPEDIVQLETIRRLIQAGATVICCGGGGIPVARGEDGPLHGLEAVVDKDRTSALLARSLGARRLVMTTGVDRVYRDFLTASPVSLPEVGLAELRALAREGQFPPGSMGPKVEAAIDFLEHGGGEVLVCRPEDLVEAFDGHTGTRITHDIVQERP
ncbi:MAG: carbamate kinase [Planctomycetes bacterium]|nr:carbamate kinase [Planctomycetota bacterium]